MALLRRKLGHVASEPSGLKTPSVLRPQVSPHRQLVRSEVVVQPEEPQSIELSLSDYAEIGALYERLRQVPDAMVSRTEGRPTAGEQGALDVLTVIASSSGLVAAIRTIPGYLQARRSGISVMTTVKGKQFTLTATNVSDVVPIIERLLDE
jgi:hypothetical protein